VKIVKEKITGKRGASALVLSGELTEGTSDLSQAMTAPGGVPALPEVNQDRAHPSSPEIDEQPNADYRQLVSSGGTQPGAFSWRTVSPEGRGPDPRPPGPATLNARAHRHQTQQLSVQRSQVKPIGGTSNAPGA
jgi:hypothetical protein